MFRIPRKDPNGFSLVELLLAMAILGVVSYMVITLTGSIRQGGNMSETEQRMEVIAAKMEEHYRAQGEMPLPDGGSFTAGNTYVWDIPIDELNMENKYAYDGWGQRIQYSLHARADDIADIGAYTVNGDGDLAGYIVSYGGNQTADVTTGTTNIDSSGDDILEPINVNSEAIEIAQEEVRELQEKVDAFDRAFAGVDNDSDNTVDGSGCVKATPTGGTTCPPLTGLTNDPNCGTASLDQIQDAGADGDKNYGCDRDAFGRDGDFNDAELDDDHDATLMFIVGYYDLSNSYLLDPWGRPYQWGCAEEDSEGNTLCNPTDDDSWVAYGRGNSRYRKFFSLGPDGTSDTDDDIIP